jgi:ABC-type Fe3+ transport system substrate-binding protein
MGRPARDHAHARSFEKLFADFSHRHPGIQIVSVSGRGGDLISRIMAERRLGKFLSDLYLGSSGTPLAVLYPAKALEPAQTFMILPEVKDTASWFKRQHHYADPENRFILVFESVVRSDMAYNTTLAHPKEFTSYWALVKPKWKARLLPWIPSCPDFQAGCCSSLFIIPISAPDSYGSYSVAWTSWWRATDASWSIGWRWESLPSRWLYPRAKFRPGSGRACP